MTPFRLILLSLALPLFAGCAPSADNVDEIWGTTSLAMTDARAEVAVDVATGAADSSDLNLEAPCADGGTMAVTGSMDMTTGDVTSATLDLSAVFNGCQRGGLTIDGDLSWSADAQMDTAATLQMTWSGSVVYSGKYNGACAIDLTATVGATGGTASASYEGTICGYDASTTLSVSY